MKETFPADAQLTAASETVSMPPPPAPPLQEEREHPSSPKRARTSSISDNVVQSSAPDTNAETNKESTPSKELVLRNPNNQMVVASRPKATRTGLEAESAAPLPSRRERKPTKKADEFREMLMASRRRFGKVREPIDTSKLTMLDLIYYNPPGAPMKKKVSEVRETFHSLQTSIELSSRFTFSRYLFETFRPQ